MSLRFMKNCLHCSLFALFLLVFQVSAGQTGVKPLDNWLEEHAHDLGGRAVLLIYQNNRIIYSHAVNELSGKQKMIGKMIARRTGKDSRDVLKDYDAETRIGIASCSKWLSAALVMTFIDEGRLSLEDTIGRFLPITTKHGKGNITILQCLSHLTGISSIGLKENKEMMQAGTMASVVEKIAGLDMEGKPGSTFHYSSNGLQLAAAVIEKISGKDFRTLFNERIAVPCGMKQTDFGGSPVPLAAGGARSTASDYLRFLVMILQNGMIDGRQVLSAKSVELMQRNHIIGADIKHSPAEAGNWGYGFGEWVMDNADKQTRSESVTSPGLFGTFPWVDNRRQYAAILFTFNLKNKGRGELYRALKKLVDSWITNH